MVHAHDAQAEGVAHGDVHARAVRGDATPADTASTAPMARGKALRRADVGHAAHAVTMHADMPPADADPAVTPVGAGQAADSTHSDHADHTTRDRAMPDHGGRQHPATAPAAPTQPRTACTCAAAATTALPREPIPPITDADRAAAFPVLREHTMQHGPSRVGYLLLDRLEGWDAERGNGQGWEASAWYGGDIHRLWLRSEGERSGGHTEAADLEALYGRAVSPWWDVLIGVQHAIAPGDARTSAAFGVQGMAPYKFEVAATLYVGEDGDASARLQGEYDVLLTNRWILQPRLEADIAFADDRARGVGSGLSTLEAGLRLRYEVSRRFAPYLGVVHERAFGATADYRRDAAEAARDTRVVAGVRVWF
ncbi:copper resistance protein B [Xanthomonas medicagonis]|uniref:copper resistance protein B n=1 Tax=Xanthomonas medicagonis TaxID=3160841 RepID=UPI0035183023